jgi:signal transduction histidine kinase
MRGVRLESLRGAHDVVGGITVPDPWDHSPEPSRRESRRESRRDRKRRRRERDAARANAEAEEILLSPEERAFRRAHELAEEKTEVTSELIWLAVIGVPLFIISFPVFLIVLIFWGSKPLKRGWRTFVEPKLRDLFIEQEVEKEVYAQLSRERQQLEGKHARSMQQLSASIAHEIRNPITAAKSLVQQMEEDPTSRENVEYARVALEELQRVERSVSHLLRFARDEELGIGDIQLSEVVDSALETFRDRLDRSGITLVRSIDCAGHMKGDPEKLRRVVINLVGNAIDAVEEAGVEDPVVQVSLGENLASTDVWLRVKDNGPGIPEELQDRLFSPFYTSKSGGTGLGLPICKKLVEAHNGTIELHSEPGHGTEFVLTFPKQRNGAGADGVPS